MQNKKFLNCWNKSRENIIKNNCVLAVFLIRHSIKLLDKDDLNLVERINDFVNYSTHENFIFKDNKIFYIEFNDFIIKNNLKVDLISFESLNTSQNYNFKREKLFDLFNKNKLFNFNLLISDVFYFQNQNIFDILNHNYFITFKSYGNLFKPNLDALPIVLFLIKNKIPNNYFQNNYWNELLKINKHGHNQWSSNWQQQLELINDFKKEEIINGLDSLFANIEFNEFNNIFDFLNIDKNEAGLKIDVFDYFLLLINEPFSLEIYSIFKIIREYMFDKKYFENLVFLAFEILFEIKVNDWKGYFHKRILDDEYIEKFYLDNFLLLVKLILRSFNINYNNDEFKILDKFILNKIIISLLMNDLKLNNWEINNFDKKVINLIRTLIIIPFEFRFNYEIITFRNDFLYDVKFQKKNSFNKEIELNFLFFKKIWINDFKFNYLNLFTNKALIKSIIINFLVINDHLTEKEILEIKKNKLDFKILSEVNKIYAGGGNHTPKSFVLIKENDIKNKNDIFLNENIEYVFIGDTKYIRDIEIIKEFNFDIFKFNKKNQNILSKFTVNKNLKIDEYVRLIQEYIDIKYDNFKSEKKYIDLEKTYKKIFDKKNSIIKNLMLNIKLKENKYFFKEFVKEYEKEFDKYLLKYLVKRTW